MQTFKQYLAEDLRKWFKQKWVRMDTKGNIKGDCARDPGEGKPKCLPQAKAHALGKEGRAAAARRKRREDPNPERRGAPINVRTEEVDEACWTGYTAKGMKKKGNRMVPNCVKEDGVGGGAIGGSAGPTNVTGVATSTDPISATAFNRKKRKSPVMLTIRRKSPKV